MSFGTHPSGQSKLSSGLTSGTSDLEMKLPSTYTLEVPGRRVYSEAFLIWAYKLFEHDILTKETRRLTLR